MRLLICTQKVDQADPILSFFHSWIIEIAKQVKSVEIICLEEGSHDLPSNVHISSLGKEGGISRMKYLSRFYRYIWGLRNKYDVVLVHMNPEYAVLGGIFWRLAGKRIALWYTHKNVDLKLRLATFLSNVVITASTESFRLKSSKVRVLGHGIDTRMFFPKEVPHEGVLKKIVTVGRISRTKNIHIMLDVLAKLIANGNNVSLSVVGVPVTNEDMDYKKKLLKLADSLKIGQHFEFLKLPNAELAEILQGADLFINLSSTGSLDKAVLEAMACNVPVLTSNEAFKDILPEELIVVLNSAEIASSAEMILKSGKNYPLRNIIEESHSLPKLIKKIVAVLE